MEFLIWMAIGVSLMAVELVVPGGILGLIGYCAFLWGVYVALGEGTVALYAVLGLTALLIVIIIVFFNHFEKDVDRQIVYLRAKVYDKSWLCI